MRAAGDVDHLHRIMAGQVRADLAGAVDKGQVPVPHQLSEDVLEDRPEVLVDRVHLADDDLTAVDHAIEDVQRHDRRDVAGSEHQGQFTVGILTPVKGGHVLAQVLLGHAFLHPDIRGDAVKQQLIVPVERKHAGDQLAVYAAVQLDMLEQICASIEGGEGLDRRRQPRHQAVRPGEPCFGAHQG